MCAQGRPDETLYGVRVFAGEMADAYLQRAAIQRGYTVVIWRGRHVAEPTELASTRPASTGSRSCVWGAPSRSTSSR